MNLKPSTHYLLLAAMLGGATLTGCGLSIDDAIKQVEKQKDNDKVTDTTAAATCAPYTGPEQVLVITSPGGGLGELLRLNPETGTEEGGVSDIGNVPNRLRMCGDSAYVVNSTSHDVKVYDAATLAEKATLDLGDGVNPWDVAFASGKGFVSGLLDGKVHVFEVTTATLLDTVIDAGVSPNGMYATEQTVFVANSGYKAEGSVPGTLTVIDAASLTVTATVDLGCDNSMWVEGTGDRVFVMCGGKIEYGPAPDYAMTVVSTGQIVELSATTHEVVGQLNLAFNPGGMSLAGNRLFLGGFGAGLSVVSVDPLAVDVPLADGVLAWEDVLGAVVDDQDRVWVAQWFQKSVKILNAEYATETTVDIGANAQDIVYLKKAE